MEEETLIHLYHRGFLPGPGETEEAFMERVALFEEVRREPHQVLSKLPFKVEESCELPLSTPFTYDWLIVVCSDKRLPFWERAATWTLCQTRYLKLPVLQIRTKTKGSALKEVLNHESVHILRTAFDEMRFEEILAYRTSKNGFRRYLSPLFRKPWEALFFVLSLFFAFLGELTLLFFTSFSAWVWIPFLVPLFFTLYLGVKLVHDQSILQKFLKKLESLFPKKKIDEIVLFFTDKEIALFASLPKEELREFFHKPKLHDLRIRLLVALNLFQ